MTTDDDDATFYQFTPLPPPSGSDPDAGGMAQAPFSVPDGAPGGSSGSRKRRRRSRVTKTAAGLALVLGAGAGAGAVVMATSSGGATTLASTSATTPTTTPARNRPGGRFMWGMNGGGPGAQFRFGGPLMGFAGMGAGGVVHGSFTVKGPSGAYETLDTQVGTVQDVSSSSITVKSADGYSQQYTVGSSTVVDADYDGIGSVKTGDEVSVVGIVGSSGVTAERIVDVTQVQANGSTWRPSPPGAPPTTNGNAGGNTTGAFGDGNFPGGDGPGSAA